MRARRQSYLPGFEKAAGAQHGGDLAKGKRKTFRPIDPKQALHVVLRSSKAHGEFSLLHPRHCNVIERHVRKIAKRCGVRVYRFANVGNHLHLLIKVPSRPAWKRFAKQLSGGIAQIVTGARKGAALSRISNETSYGTSDADLPESAQRAFWDHLLFTRIVSFGRDFTGVARYLIKNLFEAAGVPMKALLAKGLRLVFVEPDGRVSVAPS
jgi:REP element-mobilizing transposase RayT